MNHGKVEQISAPYEFYTRPQSLFVAQFIGRNPSSRARRFAAEDKAQIAWKAPGATVILQ